MTDLGLVGWPARQSFPRVLNGKHGEAPALTLWAHVPVGRLGQAYPPLLIPAPLFPTFLWARPPSFPHPVR